MLKRLLKKVNNFYIKKEKPKEILPREFTPLDLRFMDALEK